MIRTIYEDAYLLIVDKPSGLLTVPTPKKEKNTLTDILRFYPCHRLDRETSGLIIYAKSRKVEQLMRLQFHRRQVKKEYIAFVSGRLERSCGQLKSFISAHPREPKKLAVTNYKIVRQFKDFAQVLVVPETGRTNQIRLQFKQIGHPLLGESRFAFRRDFKIKFKRVALHASRISFKHPLTQRQMDFSLPLSADLESLLKQREDE